MLKIISPLIALLILWPSSALTAAGGMGLSQEYLDCLTAETRLSGEYLDCRHTYQATGADPDKMFVCANKEYLRQEAELKLLDQKILKLIDDTRLVKEDAEADKNSYRKASQAWIAFREAQAELVAELIDGSNHLDALKMIWRAEATADQVGRLEELFFPPEPDCGE